MSGQVHMSTFTPQIPMASILLDCFCDTCGRQITMDELMVGFHDDHHFAFIELAALEAMRAYLRTCDSRVSQFEFPHSERHHRD